MVEKKGRGEGFLTLSSKAFLAKRRIIFRINIRMMKNYRRGDEISRLIRLIDWLKQRFQKIPLSFSFFIWEIFGTEFASFLEKIGNFRFNSARCSIHSTSRNLTSIAPRSSADFQRMRIVISSRWEEKGLNIENLARSKIFLIGKKRHSLMNSRCITLRRIFTKPFSSFELNACQSVPCNSHINLTVSFSRRNEPCQPRIPINFANAPSRRAAISISVFRLREEATGKWNFERFSFFFLFFGEGEGGEDIQVLL